MSGRGKKKQSFNTVLKNKMWHLAGYGRRSFDDGDTEESYTITNQRKLLEDYVEEREKMIIEDYYMDDGYTGTNFNRPSFQRMLQDIVNGKIDGIIVKDLSRLGRNYKETGKYLEEIFPIYNVRIIAINDNIDSFLDPESVSSFVVPFKNLSNEHYSRDISKKVSSAYEIMAKSGQYVAGTTPYGYKFDPEDKHHLIIDEEEAVIVRKIFQMAVEGEGRIKICKYLNDNGILCRKELQRRKKRKLTLESFEIESKYLWGTTTIGRMLSNVCYIGNLAQLKTKRKYFGRDDVIYKKEDEWITVENTHESIISKKDFEKVQSNIKKNTKKRSEPINYSIFNGILKCFDCGKSMNKQEDFRNNRNISNYYCSTFLRAGHLCTSHKIKTSVLESIVLEAIQLQIKLVIELERSLTKLYLKNNSDSLKNEYKNNIRIIEIKIENLKENKREYYENWKFEKLEKQEFVKYSNDIDNKISELNKEIELYTSTYRETVKKIRKNDYWIGHYKRNRRIKKLTKEVMKELIEIIYLHDDGTVEIKFKYNDEYLKLVEFLESEGVRINEKMVNGRVPQIIC